MSQPEPRKLFSVERRAMGAQQAPGADTVGAMAIPMHPSSTITNDALMEELRAMRAEIAEIRNGAVEAVAAPVDAEDGAEEDALLNGPALAGGGLSQDDIDALFD